MAQPLEGTTKSFEAVRFSFFTDEEVRKHSVVKITSPILLDSMERPVPGGLYDLKLGPADERTPCVICQQRAFNCPGHFGRIDLVSPAYNPLLFNILHSLLQCTCFFCHHFRATRSQVETCVSQLKLIVKGDLVGAKRLDLDTSSETSYPDDIDVNQYNDKEHLCQQGWTSLQFTEAMSALRKFLKPRSVVCKNCEARNPKISKPTFGWFYMNGRSGANARRNVIQGCKVGRSLTGGTNGKTLLEVQNTNDMTPWGDVVDTAETETSSATSSGAQDSPTRRHRRKGGEVPLEFLKQKDLFSGPLLPSEVKDIMKLLWENESQLCSFISDIQQQGLQMKDAYSIFFLETILVPPTKFRPPSKGSDSVMEHPQTVLLNKVLQSNISLGNAHVNNLEHSKIVRQWMDLQQSINVLFDSKTATGQGRRDVASGICQLLEKKEGMFRQKMMGKRVNFACRSVISPDPYLAVNEIGIPPYFALRLTYPERVTPWNVEKLRKAIINGPEIHPGATHYVDKQETRQLPAGQGDSEHKKRTSTSRKLSSSQGLLTQHGKGCDYEFEGKFVRRHLQDGDIVLVNRQPTLHKPSIMAHVVRVLKGEKTIRMHYANCSTYNADFDGDEMNVHFPQDEISRSEAYNIVNANNQYVKPTSGEPIRSLIQDHIISAVLLTKKDTFFNRDQFNQLLYCAGLSAPSPVSLFGQFGQKVCILNSEDEMQPLLPAIWKPEPLWTGKQVISALLNHITKGHPPFSVEKDAKLPRDFFKSRSDEDKLDKEKLSKGRKVDVDASKRKEPDEDKLLIYKNDLVRGVIDKAQFGEYGLVHMVQELYGSNTAGILLSALSRLFTTFLQMHAATCGVDDLLLMENKDYEREKNLQDCEKVGEDVHLLFVNGKGGDQIDADVLRVNIEKKIRSNGESALTDLDRKMISKLNEELSKNFFKELLSKGLFKPSGKNCISLMTTSGAKGATVNFQQISSHLGQQELEGKRVPRMVSGKTLPCFSPWDWAARAGGFIIDRFLSGLHPQEYYFHCMAGREGLVDTAVKTSRSGYLQRCLIKNLECLKICYDYTVRDADGSIVQFRYGEDGVDVHQTSFMANFEALAANQEIIFTKCCQELHKSNSYIKELPYALKEKARDFVHKFSLKKRNPDSLKEKDFLKLMEHKYVSSLAQPGEPVGVLAGQSVGEPSTQMTLNTFHLAGRGEMNVTLGIPRLQEILMTASSDIKTPVMTCPFQLGSSKKDASRLADKLKKITVADIIKSMKVSVMPAAVHDHQNCRIYKLEMMLYIPENYPKHTDISLEDWEESLRVVFVRELEDAIQNHLLLLSKISGIKNFMPDSQSDASNGTDDDVSGNRSERQEENDDDDDGGTEDLGLDAQKRKQQATDEMDYEDTSDEEPNEGELTAGSESEIDHVEDEVEVSKNDVIEMPDAKDKTSELSGLGKSSKQKSKSKKNQPEVKKKKRSRGKLVKKEYDRACFVKAKGMHFEVHFRFIGEPHILLAQIALKTAKKVYIQSFGKIDGCKVISCKEKQVIYFGINPKDRKNISPAEKEKVPALQTTGVEFSTLWQFQDVLDVRYIYSNNIHAMLTTFGVEAARETIIREIQHVFGSYGISVNMRHLPNLTIINFFNNSINSTVPSNLSKCSNLRHLDLSQNLLTGALPRTLADLHNLVYLDLTGNNFSGAIPDTFGRFQKLEVLSLVYNLLDGTIPAFLGNISTLKMLNLSYNPFVPGPIPSELGNLTNLEVLWLTDCNLVGEIPDSLGRLKKLTDLDLALNELHGPIPTALTGLTSVVQIELYNNSLSGVLPPGMSNLTALRLFDASMNELTGPIPDELCRLPLESLNLYENRFKGSLPESIADSPGLYELRLFRNQLTGELPRNLGRHSPLKWVDISNNQFSGELPASLCEKGALEELLVIYNQFSGPIPERLGECQSLTRVRVGYNRFSGEVPAGFWGLPRVYLLELVENSFSGQIAKTIAGAANLSLLFLSKNNFSGPIPDEIGWLENLVGFSGNDNSLSGSLPESIVNLEQLGILDLHNNQLSGELPSGIKSWKKLNELNLANNKFSGKIPEVIGSLSVLNYLDLSKNRFSGKIPLGLQNLKLNQLNLSYNQLSGELPPMFAKKMYENSFLGNPRLCRDLEGLCDGKGEAKSKGYIWLLRTIFVLAALVFIVGVVWFYMKYRNFKNAKRAIDKSKWTLMSFHKLGFSEHEILDCLDEDNLIGSGSSGKVYKVVLSNGEVVAVKRLWGGVKKECENGDVEKGQVHGNVFDAEVDTLGKIRHKNIVKLWCCCTTRDCKLLVYEYMPNGSLGDLLHSSKAGLLDWPTRFKVALDAAEGLSYLHHDCVPAIVHRDVKSNNILLDGEFGARVSDFGLAKVIDSTGKGPKSMSVIAGSCGYIAPEYAYTLRVNEKSDIYSFGVVILELVTGRLPVDPEFGEKDLVKWVCTTLDQKGVDHVIDAKLDSCYKEEICKLLNIGLLCTSPLPINRPAMRRVVKLLQEAGPETQSKTAKKEGKLSPYYYEDASDHGSVA